jgi:hypothetical protein
MPVLIVSVTRRLTELVTERVDFFFQFYHAKLAADHCLVEVCKFLI